MRKRTVWIVSGALLAGLAGGAWWWATREEAPTFRTAPVTRGPIEVTVTATGALQAITTVQVGTQVSGTIAALYVDFNDRVAKGQVIARLDSTLLKAALRDAQSGQERVAALAQQSKAERDRARTLFARELISRAELEQAEASSRVAAANLSSAQAQVERARINLRYAIIESPIDGIVLSRAVELGQTVAASFNTPTLFTIAGDMSEMRVQAAVDEADIGRLKVGQKATFTVDAYPDTSFSGVVEQVRLQPVVTQNVVTYDVILRAANPGGRLMPGMTANLTIVTERTDDVLRVPTAALRFTPPVAEVEAEAKDAQGATTGGADRPRRQRAQERDAADGAAGTVYILENGAPKAVRVRTGLSDGTRTAVEGDLAPDAEVVVGVVSTDAATTTTGAPFGMQQTRGSGASRR
jgi:HlyD family secretion protein